MKEANRELLLSFWKAHILHHAGEEPIHGQWILDELRRHGYQLSPGTLYPLLGRMERWGWLKGSRVPGSGMRARKDYRLTPEGRKVLAMVRVQIGEMHREVVKEGRRRPRREIQQPGPLFPGRQAALRLTTNRIPSSVASSAQRDRGTAKE